MAVEISINSRTPLRLQLNKVFFKNVFLKKSGAGAAWKKSGAGAAKKLTGSSALLEDKSIRKLYFCYSSVGNIVSYYG